VTTPIPLAGYVIKPGTIFDANDPIARLQARVCAPLDYPDGTFRPAK
jgi:hypothetical protein